MNELTLLFAGDFAPCRRFEAIAIERRGALFGQLRDEISNADFAFVNLETPLCAGGTPISKVGPNLRADPRVAAALSEAGFDIVGLANNHILDFGGDGLASTLETCARLNMRTCGAGGNSTDAERTLILSRGGMTAALIALAEQEFNAAHGDQPGAAVVDAIVLAKRIREVRSKVDVVVVTVHGGNEYFPYPRPGLRRLCQHAIEMGADAVVCHHPHVPGASETYQGRPIHYSLGNLIFDAAPAPKDWQLGYAATLKFCRRQDGTIDVHTRSIPYAQSVELGGLRLLSGHELDKFLSQLDIYRGVLADENEWRAEWKKYCRQQRLSCVTDQYMPIAFPGMRKFVRLLSLDRIILPRSSLNRRKNMLRCESHRELLVSMLELE